MRLCLILMTSPGRVQYVEDGVTRYEGHFLHLSLYLCPT